MRQSLIAIGLCCAVASQARADLTDLPPMNFTIVTNKLTEAFGGGSPISCGGHCREIYAEGPIDNHASDRLESLITEQHLPDRTMVHLNSPGGSLYGGMELGRVLRRHKMGVNVGGRKGGADCISACTLAYMGGLFRWIPTGAHYGIHRFFNNKGVAVEDPIAEAQLVSGDIAAYLHEMGINPEFLTKMSRIASENYLVLDMPTLQALSIVNEGVIPTNWTIDIYDGLYSLQAAQLTLYGLDTMMFSCSSQRLLLTVSMQRDVRPFFSSAVLESLQLDDDYGHSYELRRIKHEFAPAKPLDHELIPTTMINTYEVPAEALPKLAEAKRMYFHILMGGSAIGLPRDNEFDPLHDAEFLEKIYQLEQAKYHHDNSDAPWSFEVNVPSPEHDRVAKFIKSCH
jgi:hypothetical protein